jgi:hypothetical protein
VCGQPGCGHHACLTGPGGNWCADHLEPHQRRVNAPAFVPSSEWQDIPPDTVLPDGLQIQVDTTTGRKRARLHPDAQPNAKAPEFVLTTEWQLVPDGWHAVLGCEVRPANAHRGKMARLAPDDDAE